jgi:hypothetical protein
MLANVFGPVGSTLSRCPLTPTHLTKAEGAMAYPDTPPETAPSKVQRGDRLECSACGEVSIWCQCEPSPFTDEDHAVMSESIRRHREIVNNGR